MKFEELIRDVYKLSKSRNLIGILHGTAINIGFKGITDEDLDKLTEHHKWDMLYLKSIPTDTEIQIYEYELKDFKVNTSEETLYVLTTHGETRLKY